jgi:peptidoglycan-associated lipoprotein
MLSAGCSRKPPVEPDVTQTPPADSSDDTQPPVRDNGDKPQVKTPDTAGILVPIHFDFDKYEIRSDARPVLEGIGNLLKDHPQWEVRIEGHCDERGTHEYNLGLGENRAQAAKSYLAKLGIDASRFRTKSYGEERPVDDGHDEKAWSKNRRAEFFVESSGL